MMEDNSKKAYAKLLSRFVFERVLHEDRDDKKVHLLGHLTASPVEKEKELTLEEPHISYDSTNEEGEKVEDEGKKLERELELMEGPAIVVLTRNSWDDTKEFLNFKEGGIEILYEFKRPATNTTPVPTSTKRFKAKFSSSGNVARLTLVHPVTKEDISRYKSKHLELVMETPEEWREVSHPVLPTRNPSTFLDTLQDEKDGELGKQFVVHEQDAGSIETGFLLLADPQWNRTQPLGLNCVVLPVRRDLHSLRDLNESHLPLLRNILNTLKPSAGSKVGGGVLYDKFKVWASRVCIFVEYLPRFYRLHFRVTQYENRYSLPLFADQVKDDLAPHEKERSYYLLEDIIENITMLSDYYQQKSLLYQLDRFDELHFRLCEYRWFGKRTEQRLAICDFHCHSVHSDGRHTVEEIMEKAHKNGLKIFSLTDHDNMAGVAKAIELGKHYGIEVIPGVEISTETESGENVHVLGYFPLSMSTEDNAQLQEQLEQIREARYTRGKEMLKRLAELNIHLEWDRILELAGEAAPGRPHVADALVEKGYVADFRAAFDLYLGQDKPAFVQGRRFPPEEAVALIRRLSGFSVLAHPWCCKAPQNLIRLLAANGLQGMEVYTGNLTLREEFSRLADEHSLVKMGGSDFHGRDDEENRLGNLPIPDDVGKWMLTCAKESGWPTTN